MTQQRATPDLRLRRLEANVVGPEGPDHPWEGLLSIDRSRDTAFFRLRLEIVPPNTFAYLILPPEQIISLSHDQSRVQGSSPRRTICLRLALSTPAFLLGPPTRPSIDVNEKTMGFLRFLTTQTTLAMHVPADEIDIHQLQSLESALSARLLKTDELLADERKLYRGEGAAIIQFDNQAAPSVMGQYATPPAYEESNSPSLLRSVQPNEVPTTPGKRPLANPGGDQEKSHASVKRTRADTRGREHSSADKQAALLSHADHTSFSVLGGLQAEDAPPDYSKRPCGEPEGAQREMSRLLRTMLMELQACITDEFSQRLELMKGDIVECVEDRVKRAVEEMKVEVKNAVKAEVKSAVEELKDELKNAKQEAVDEVLDEVADDVSNARDEAIECCKEIVDDMTVGIKVEMEEYVKNEMGATEELILDRVQSHTWSLQLSED